MDSRMGVQIKGSDTGIINSIESSIIVLLSALLIFMLLLDWAINPFVNNLKQSDIHTIVYENAYEGLNLKPYISNGKGAEGTPQGICIGLYDFQTDEFKSRKSTLVTLVPSRKFRMSSGFEGSQNRIQEDVSTKHILDTK